MAKDVTEPGTRNRSIETAVGETAPVSLPEAIEALSPITAIWAEPDEPPVIASGRAATVTGSGPSRFRTVKRRADALYAALDHQGVPRPARPRLFGGFSFFDEETLDPPWTDFEPAGFVLPAIQVTLDRDRTWVTSLGDEPADRLGQAIESLETARENAEEVAATRTDASDRHASRPTSPGSDSQSAEPVGLTAERSAWTERVRTVRDTIRDSDLKKVVLSAAYELDRAPDLDLGSVLAALESRYPDCYRFSFAGPRADPTDPEGASFFGASPERLVEKRETAIETEALAGTVERGEDPTLDERQIERLSDDETLAREHELVATQITDQLNGLGAEVTVGEREIQTLANVHHLRTPIRASLPPNVHVLDIVASLHPTPALGGLPREKARETIADIETTVRGWYGAPVGWFDAAGDGTFAVGIRSALVAAGRATLFAGNGIVAGSDPETEWRELEAKFEPIREVLE
ncbi:MAG: isochorismate synthase MenF [Halodesulfurarchaeum sp.]